MNVTLPSGRVAPLEPPSLLGVLARGGSVDALVSAVWAYPEVDAAALDEGDAYFAAMWALRELCASDDGAELALVCKYLGEAPSARLRVTDPALAYGFDRACILAAQGDPDPEPEPGDVHHRRYSFADDWTPDA